VLVKMPQLGESVTEGTIGRWLKRVGDKVDKYEPLVEVTTDKVNAEVPSPVAGEIRRIIGKEGDTLQVGDLVCEIATDEAEEEGGSVSDERAPDVSESKAAELVAAPEGARAGEFVRTSPYVRRLAKEAGVDLRQVVGSGSGGRVTRRDLEAHVTAGGASPRSAALPLADPSHPGAPSEPVKPPRPVQADLKPGVDDTLVPLTPMRRSIAEHMVRTKRESPHATAWFEVDVTGLRALREKIKDSFSQREGVPLTFLPFVIQAAVEALRSYPVLNSSFDAENMQIVLHRRIHMGVAVAVDEGLIVPVVKDADALSLTGLAHRLDDLISRARAGRLTLQDIQGGTFTVNNPGSYGSILSTPLINQPQAAILSMEKIVKRAQAVNDAIAIRSMMNLSLSFDHRVLDGAVANLFLARVKEVLEGLTPASPVL